MRNSWGAVLTASGLVVLAAAAVVSGCGSSGARPATEDNTGGDSGAYVPSTVGDGGKADGEAGTDPKVTYPEYCSDSVKDSTETDVDCGGGTCPKCFDGMKCASSTDCLGGNCDNGVCSTGACTDTLPNGGETDVDCGGPVCRRCTIGKKCASNSDCVNGACSQPDGTGKSFCQCPKGMAVVSRRADGASYCIDSTEVTKYQYNQFINSGYQPSDQIDVCKTTNTEFKPRAAWPVNDGLPSGLNTGVAQAFNFSLPVHYVDWCDAYAYCKWAKKELCGSTAGGTAAFDKPADASSDAWYNACSAGGAYAYPYNPIFSNEICNGGQGVGVLSANNVAGPTSAQRSNYGAIGFQDDGIYAPIAGDLTGNGSINKASLACQGGSTGVYDIVGNVAEWEDSCDGTGATANCRVRGGSYKTGVNNAAGLRCDDASRTLPRVPSAADNEQLRDVGFRCCLF